MVLNDLFWFLTEFVKPYFSSNLSCSIVNFYGNFLIIKSKYKESWNKEVLYYADFFALMRNLGKVMGPCFNVVMLCLGFCETEVKGLGNTLFWAVLLNNKYSVVGVI